jgi:trehalose 6-phosphate synthase
MRRGLKFLLVLIVGLGLLTWGASTLVYKTMGEWFEKDIKLRGQLAVDAARSGFIAHWKTNQQSDLLNILNEITQDERIMAAAACDANFTLLTTTSGFPDQISCPEIGYRVRQSQGSSPSAWHFWESNYDLPRGRVHISATPLVDAGQIIGFVVLVHDLGFIERREATTRNFLLIAFGFLSFLASLITIISVRLSWRGWSNELRRFIKGETQRPEFQPVLRDVRELIDRVMTEKDAESEGGTWGPQRLKQALYRHLHGEKVIIVANREPYIHERTKDGTIAVFHPASGLVTALEPVMRACSGVWVAHGSGSADRETVDKHDHLLVPPGEESYTLRRVWLTAEEEKGYYYGFSNEGLWPLCHLAHARPNFRTEDWRYYQTINTRFADVVCEEVDTDDPIILLQDYHFALAPRLIRERLPRSTIITFWHIPWPNSERFGICPWGNELLEGMLGTSILGFHTQFHCNNFIDTVDRFLESRIDRAQNAVIQHGRSTLIRPYPISIEWPVRWVSSAPPPAECRAQIFAELGLPKNALLGVGVDRLDYTKGVEERLAAVERLLERFPEYRGRFFFVQLAAPSRTAIERYRQLNESVETMAAQINKRFEQGSYRPIILLRSHHEPPAVFRYYRAADICYVSSLHDGMNLVAKEFIAAREDERGVLVLSQFTGAAHELTEALIVNPYDLDEASSALAAALGMSVDEQQERMHSMRTFIAEFNVYRWAGRMLVDAARLRRRERLTGRLSDYL